MKSSPPPDTDSLQKLDIELQHVQQEIASLHGKYRGRSADWDRKDEIKKRVLENKKRYVGTQTHTNSAHTLKINLFLRFSKKKNLFFFIFYMSFMSLWDSLFFRGCI